MKWNDVVRLALALPETAEGIWFRTPCVKVRGKSFVRLKEDARTVVFLLEDAEEQELLTRARPAVYFITDHYRGYPAVLARLAKLTPTECRERLEGAWRSRAPKTVVKKFDAARADADA